MLPSPCPSSPTAATHGPGGEEQDEARRVTTEYKRLTEQRDEAERQLKHIKRVSQMVIEEVSALQTQLEIEKSCRENAEALATKLNCENKKLKYLSLSSRPCLDELLPSISDCIALDEEAEPQDSSPDPYAQYQQQVKDLQDTVNGLLDEKKQLTCQLKDQQRQVEELTVRSEKDHSEMKELYKTIEEQNQTIKKFNRVSMMAAQEYEGLREQLELEQSLRQKAECFAHEMMVKQKEANRQSMVLLQQAEPSVQLLKALEDLANVTKMLEQERLQHQHKVQALETALQESTLHRQLTELQKQMDLLEEEKREVEGGLQEVEKQNSTLEARGGCLPLCLCICVSPHSCFTPHLTSVSH
ncbi:shootin-1-like isoform X2 [Arapaima gigas]